VDETLNEYDEDGVKTWIPDGAMLPPSETPKDE